MHAGTGIVYSTGGCIHKKLTCRERKGEGGGGVVDGGRSGFVSGSAQVTTNIATQF